MKPRTRAKALRQKLSTIVDRNDEPSCSNRRTSALARRCVQLSVGRERSDARIEICRDSKRRDFASRSLSGRGRASLRLRSYAWFLLRAKWRHCRGQQHLDRGDHDIDGRTSCAPTRRPALAGVAAARRRVRHAPAARGLGRARPGRHAGHRARRALAAARGAGAACARARASPARGPPGPRTARSRRRRRGAAPQPLSTTARGGSTGHLGPDHGRRAWPQFACLRSRLMRPNATADLQPDGGRAGAFDAPNALHRGLTRLQNLTLLELDFTGVEAALRVGAVARLTALRTLTHLADTSGTGCDCSARRTGSR